MFGIDRTHASFNVDACDDVVIDGNWIFGVQNDGYGKYFQKKLFNLTDDNLVLKSWDVF